MVTTRLAKWECGVDVITTKGAVGHRHMVKELCGYTQELRTNRYKDVTPSNLAMP